MEHVAHSAGTGPATDSIKRVGAMRAFHWLELGWNDFTGNPVPSIAHGAILAATGWIIVLLCSSRLELLALAISGFLLVGPIFGAGFYALSRLRANGQQKAGFDRSLDAARKNIGALARLGGILAVIAIIWGVVSRALFQQTFGAQMPELEVSFYRTIFDWSYPRFALVYIGTGAVLAVLAFVISAISAPMIFDRGGNTRHAIATSIKAVAHNPLTMLIWAALIVAFTIAGFATFMIGLVITLPLIGHATWHAYRDLVA